MKVASIASVVTFAFLATVAVAKAPEVYTGRFSDLAVGGYDAVAYFEEGKPVKGVKQFELVHKGATWRFASADNLNQFKASPGAFEPQYGGYCAWAVAQGYVAPGNPKNWSLRDGKLYLNYDDDVQAKWLKDPDGFIKRANVNWPATLEN